MSKTIMLNSKDLTSKINSWEIDRVSEAMPRKVNKYIKGNDATVGCLSDAT